MQKIIKAESVTTIAAINDNNSVALEQSFPSASLADDIGNMLLRVVEDAPAESVERFSSRLYTAGVDMMSTGLYNSMLAETIYYMKQEGDFKFFLKPDADDTYRHWDEFHEDLVRILGIAESTSWYYQKVMRYADEVLHLREGEFPQVGGLITVSKMLKMSIVNSRDKESWAATARPRTAGFTDILEQYEGETYAEKMQAFFDTNVAHDYLNPNAINKPVSELNLLVDESLGRPKVWWELTDDSELIGHLVYPDGEKDTVEYTTDDFIAPPFRDDLERKLRIGKRVGP